MKTFKITNKTICKLEAKLQHVLETSYQSLDGLYVSIEEVSINYIEDNFFLDYTIRWGRMVDDKCDFQHTTKLYVESTNLTFIAGQFYEAISNIG